MKAPNVNERSASAQERIAEGLERLVSAQEQRERDVRDERERNRIGSRSEPRRIGIDLAFRRFEGFAALFERQVPSEFWTIEGFSAVVACPCGVEEPPKVRTAQTATCECGRSYLYTGETVRVAFSPAANRATPVAS